MHRLVLFFLTHKIKRMCSPFEGMSWPHHLLMYFFHPCDLKSQGGGLWIQLHQQLELEDDELAPLVAALKKLGVKKPEVGVSMIAYRS